MSARETLDRLGRRVRDFWQRVTEGLQLEDLWTQFKSEARASYGFYSQDVDWEAVNRATQWQRPFYIARALFWALILKLSPARRVLLLLAIAMLVFSGMNVRRDLGILGTLTLFLLLVLELADRVTMKRDLVIAREIQQWLVPEAPPAVPGVDIAFATRPANTVAGDYYDAFLRPGNLGGHDRASDAASLGASRLLLVVADVAGKGVPAALLMATFQASLRALAALPNSLAELVAGLNRYSCGHSLQGGRFTTALLAELDPATRALTYINAGHNPPVLRHASGSFERLEAGGLPLGIEPEAAYESGSVTLAPGDLLVIFTDGVIEAINEDGQEFGEGLLLELLRASPGGLGVASARGKSASGMTSQSAGETFVPSAAATLDELIAAVERFAGATRQHDDITCLVLRTT